MPPGGYNDEVRMLDRSARRREKSRDAARCRRQQESDTYNEICKVIPIPAKSLLQMDRSAVMRLLLSFMKLRKVVECVSFDQNTIKCEVSRDLPNDEEYVNALNGFVVVLSHDFDLLYVSSNVKQYVGIASLDLIGQNLFGYTHEGDHGEIANCMKVSTKQETDSHYFFMRMKSTLTSSGKNVNLKSATYKVLKCDGIVHHAKESNNSFMVAYCEPIPHPANIEMVLDCKTFLSQHSLDMKFTFCDSERISQLLGYSEEDMLGRSCYEFCHTCDLKHLDASMQKLFRLGQVTTNRYRMLAKYGGYVWLVSQATIINNQRNQQPSYVVCVHYIIGDIVHANRTLSLAQIENLNANIPAIVKQEVPFEDDGMEKQLIPQDCTEAVFCDSTNSIFCDIDLDDTNVVSFPDKVLEDKLSPSTKSMELMAQNAPSIGDELNFQDLFDIDSDELGKNAPSIGDPNWICSTQIQDEKIEDYFNDVNINMNADRGYLKNNFEGYGPQALRTPPPSVVQNVCRQPPLRDHGPEQQCHLLPLAPKARPVPQQPPKGGFRVIHIPKSQYKRHIQQLPMKRDNEYNYERGPPDDLDPLMKKAKYSPMPEGPRKRFHNPQYTASQNIPDTAKLLLTGKHTDGHKSSLAALLLKPGNMYDSYDMECGLMDRRSPCRDSAPSRCPVPDGHKNALLPVLSLHDCEVNAPVGGDRLSAADWMALSSGLAI